MSDEPSQTELTADEVIYRFERQLNHAILWVFLSGFAWVITGGVLFYIFRDSWHSWVMLGACVLIGGMTQRMFVVRVRCPVCGARVLGHIHSVLQARHVRECFVCGVKLRD